MPRKTIKIAAAFALAATGGTALTSGFAIVAATNAAQTAVDRLRATNPALQIGSVNVNPFVGNVTLHDVAFAKGALSVHAGRIVLPMPVFSLGLIGSASADALDRRFQLAQWPKSGAAPKEESDSDGSGAGIELKIPGGTVSPPAAAAAVPAPAAAAAAPVPTAVAQTGTASASDVTITRGKSTYTIKKMDLTGTSLTSADLATLLDPNSPETIETRLRKVNAASIVIPQVSEVDQKHADGSVYHADLNQIILANVANGRIGAASAAGAVLNLSGKSSGTVFKTGAIQASGLDLGLIAHMVGGALRTDEAMPLQTLSDALTVNDIILDSLDGTTISIGAIAQKNLKARPLKTDLRTLKDNSAADHDPAKEAASKEQMKAVADDVASSFEIGAFSLDKIVLATKSDTGPLTMGIAKISLQDFAHRSLGGFAVRDFVIDAAQVKGTFESLQFSNVIIPPMNKGAADPATALATDSVPAVGKADINKIALEIVTPAKDGTSTDLKFALAHFGATSVQTAGRMPSQGTVTLDNLVFDLPDGDNAAAKQLTSLGYRHLDLSAVTLAAYDAELETLQVQKFLVSGVEMGSVNLAIDFGNVNKGVMSANPSVAKASALAMLLKRIDLRVVNAGLVEKAFDWKAKQDGKTAAEERQSATDLVTAVLPESLGNGPGIKAIGAAVAKFINDPKTLHVGLASKDGLGLSDMGLINAPADLLGRLDIQADADQ